MRLYIFLLSLFVAPLAAQELVWERNGATGNMVLVSDDTSASVANVGDLDKDGCEDLLVIGENLVTGYRSELFFLSGRNGRTLRRVPEPYPFEYYFINVAAAGDMNGDGTPDYLTLSWEYLRRTPNRLEVRSGHDDAVLWKVERPPWEAFGHALLGGVDLDGDKRPDVVATAPYYWNGGRYGAVFAYRNSGEPLWQVIGTPELTPGLPTFWNTLGRVGDLDGDGGDDIVVGGVDAAGNGGAGGAGGLVLSGRTGQLLLSGLGPPGVQIGDCCQGCGDLDADGVPDFAVGSLYANLLYAFSGRDGHQLYRWQDSTLGAAVRAGVDFDLDGVPDIVAGAIGFRRPDGRSGALFAFSGRDGTPLMRIDPRPGYGSGGSFAAKLALLAPQPGNPFPLLAIGDPRANAGIPDLGRVTVYRTAPPGVQPLGAACAGTLARAPRIGIAGLGVLASEGVRVHLSNAPPATPALLLFGFSKTTWGSIPLPLALDVLGFRGCELFTSVDVAVPVTTGTTGNDLGYASFDLLLPLGAGSGSMYMQWLVLGQGAGAPGGLSAALEWSR